MIPKIIWQTHEPKYEDLFPFQKNIINNWKNLNYGWKHVYVDANKRSSMVKEFDSFLYSHYLKSDKITQSDIWRLIAIYNYGGFYADMDSVCVKPIEESIYKKYNKEEVVCSSIGFQHEGVNCSNFGAVKNSRIIKSVIDSLILYYEDLLLNSQIKEKKMVVYDFPVNIIFALTMEKNKNLLCFDNDYFLHSEDYKKIFDDDIDIVFNDNKIKYKIFCKNNNFPIYNI